MASARCHLREPRFEGRDVVRRRALGGEPGRLDLDDPAALEVLGQQPTAPGPASEAAITSGSNRSQSSRGLTVVVLPCRTVARPALLERAQALAGDAAADAEALGQRDLPRQRIAGRQPTADDLGDELRHDVTVQPLALHLQRPNHMITRASTRATNAAIGC